MHELTEFLFPAPAERRAGAIWAWWERRRLAYNLWVGAAGTFTLVTCSAIALLPPHPLGLIPLSQLWPGVVIFGVLANVCYTSGAVLETLAQQVWDRQLLPVGPSLFRMGLTFSVGLALFPTLLMIIAWILRLVGVVP